MIGMLLISGTVYAFRMGKPVPLRVVNDASLVELNQTLEEIWYIVTGRMTEFIDNVTVSDNAKVNKYEWISASGVCAPGASAASLTTNGNGFIIYSFADGLERYVRYNVKIPDDMDLSEDSYFCIGWSSPAQSLNCDWEMTYLFTAQNDSTDQAGTADTNNYSTSSATADGLIVTSVVTIAGGTIQSDEVCAHVILMRDGNDAGDTLGDVAELHGVAFKYVANKLGEEI